MVGHHKQQSLSVNLLHYATNQGIHTTVQLLNHVRPLLTRDASDSRMIFFQVAPEHVLHAVRGIEDAGAQSLTCFLQCIKKHPLAIIMIAVALGEECLRSEEHTSELQSRFDLVCRLLLEKKK